MGETERRIPTNTLPTLVGLAITNARHVQSQYHEQNDR
jgi:hypothetical protein